MSKVIVAHPGRQHSYRTAEALEQHNMLLKYVTTVYNSDKSHLMQWVKRVLSASDMERITERRIQDVDDDKIVRVLELSGLIEIVLYRIDKSKKIYRWWHNRLADRFGKKVARLAIREKADAVIMYDTAAKKCFEVLKAEAPGILRIMDSSLANRLYMKEIYQKDEAMFPKYAARKRSEWGHLYDRRYCSRLKAEISATQIFLAPSSFVKNSFMHSGVSSEQIFVCPYGTNFSAQITEHAVHTEKRPIQAVFVGSLSERKGIEYLLRSCKQIRDKVELTLVGSYDNSNHRFDDYLECFHFAGRVNHSRVKEYLEKADVFVLPSLGEGFSLSILEAMACGIPCIVTENSGANDAIKNGVSGFIIPIQSEDAIREKLLWCWEHQNELPQMGREACKSALEYTWKQYGERLTQIIHKCLSDRRLPCAD